VCTFLQKEFGPTINAEAMEIVRTKDRGTLQYEIFFNEDASEAVISA
jgi:hypothetical protein